ncbi:ABC transporter permease [Methylobacterium sp. Leaf399]|uniref:ABC transporter permease n=1 Tax=unclassified Methylobacterium TaxID=2615210 RepID=UPI0006F83B26|nr:MULTISPECIES: MlaE family lipid ABC transporter permease subunit [unclassified Methylobacterium]KQP50483.1 ABC transporter permease [Methylobacterium sp. Leaf108]KQT08618.1 ABC transporter permease [Methylobacterium sp. Leaf399]KQT78729.1 ABC transporter permease [Methylobacterium sp. Leaf466]
MRTADAVQERDRAGATLLEGGTVALSGRWTADEAPAVEAAAARITQDARAQPVRIDLSGVMRLDTLGAWVLERTRGEVEAAGGTFVYAGASPEHRILLREARILSPVPVPPARRGRVYSFLEAFGVRVVGGKTDLVTGLAFLGEVVLACLRVASRPSTFRGTALVNQIQQVAFNGVPIIVLISFLVGGIVAQQGIFQLQRFGAQSFVVNLIGLLILRELGVLLTSIMVAGRSGSAFTAEIGSMRMREEVDALRVMGLDPIEILIVPRILALVIGLPILAFLASLAALAGGGLVATLYGGMTIEAFLSRLQAAVSMHHVAVGLIKAPFMALIIGIIATIEGFAVEGSAESLGRHVTASVVKSIFMVIVLDGLFAVFFAAIDF